MNVSPRFNKWFNLFGLLHIIIISGLIVGYRQLHFKSQELLTTQNQLHKIQKEQKILQESVQVIHQQLLQKQTEVSLLNQVLWLIRQAKWQLKIMHQASSAEHLLQYAQKIAKANQWISLNDALTQDLLQLKQKNLISDNDIIEQIQSLYQKIEFFQKRASLHQTLTFAKKEPVLSEYPQINNLLKHLKPFMSIQRFHEDIPKILPPAQQYQVLSNILMLLTEIQMAGLNRDNSSFQSLAEAISNNWTIINPQLDEPQITEAIEKLKNMRLVLEKPIFFSSFAEVHHLLSNAGANL